MSLIPSAPATFTELVDAYAATVTAVLDLGRSFQEQVSRMGTAGEYIMVGSLVNSIISAFGTDGVALTIDGSSLETGHEIYDYTLGFFEG